MQSAMQTFAARFASVPLQMRGSFAYGSGWRRKTDNGKDKSNDNDKSKSRFPTGMTKRNATATAKTLSCTYRFWNYLWP